MLRRFRCGEDDGPEDPVFYAENMLEDADALPVVKETWDRVRSPRALATRGSAPRRS